MEQQSIIESVIDEDTLILFINELLASGRGPSLLINSSPSRQRHRAAPRLYLTTLPAFSARFFSSGTLHAARSHEPFNYATLTGVRAKSGAGVSKQKAFICAPCILLSRPLFTSHALRIRIHLTLSPLLSSLAFSYTSLPPRCCLIVGVFRIPVGSQGYFTASRCCF